MKGDDQNECGLAATACDSSASTSHSKERGRRRDEHDVSRRRTRPCRDSIAATRTRPRRDARAPPTRTRPRRDGVWLRREERGLAAMEYDDPNINENAASPRRGGRNIATRTRPCRDEATERERNLAAAPRMKHCYKNAASLRRSTTVKNAALPRPIQHVHQRTEERGLAATAITNMRTRPCRDYSSTRTRPRRDTPPPGSKRTRPRRDEVSHVHQERGLAATARRTSALEERGLAATSTLRTHQTRTRPCRDDTGLGH